MSKLEIDWSTPSMCAYCRYPIASGCDSCHNCGAPLELFSPSAWNYVVERGKRLLSWFLQMAVHGALIGGGLYLCLKVSPFLLLFPLFFVLTQGDRG